MARSTRSKRALSPLPPMVRLDEYMAAQDAEDQ